MLIVSDSRKNKISEITQKQYIDVFEHFSEYVATPKVDKIYFLNYEDKHCFIGEINSQLYSLYKGKKKKLKNTDINFYFHKLKNINNDDYKLYKQYIDKICEELISIGIEIDSGDIHGVIIDIGYNYHLYVSPTAHNITAYYAKNTKSFTLFNTIEECFYEWQLDALFNIPDKKDDYNNKEIEYLIEEKKYIDNIISKYKNAQPQLKILSSQFNKQTELNNKNFSKIYGETQIYKQKEFTFNTNIFVLEDC